MIRDQAAREAALDPSRSFIVEAPAGSGKTGLLVQRFLRLLSGVDRPESVVAMTFTRKAAAEMKTRVLDALDAAATPQSVPEPDDFKRRTRELALAVLQRDQARGWKLQDDPGRLQIQTIDSLCALLIRQMPVLSDFGGINQVIEEPTELYLSAAREMLTWLAESGAENGALFRRMALHFDNDIASLEGHLIKMLAKRDQWEKLNPGSDQQLVLDCCRLLTLAEAQLRTVFQRAGKVDFTEIARAARHALGKPDQPSDLLYSLDYKLQHLLVDEFQDTSSAQYGLVQALTEQWSLDDDHTLFLVGDPMQSIYSFREADVSLFLRCWQEKQLGAVRLTPLRLETNFRTTSSILNWVESHFAPLMPKDEPSQGAVQFRRSYSGRETEGEQPQIFASIEDKGGEEADRIVEIINANEASRVAILVRSRTHSAKILPALRRAEIAYEAIDIESLRDQQHIIDLLSLTRALTNVADRVSWLACLRAPWCGLTLHDLSAIAEGKRDAAILDLISDSAVVSSLSVEGRWRVVRVQEILSRAVERSGRVPLRSLVEQTWQELGGLAAMPANNQREDAATLFRLIEDSEEGGIIRDFSLLNKRLDLLYARPFCGESRVVIMTINQAKGLEFDIVVVPQLDRKVKTNENELLVWTDVQDEDGRTSMSVAGLPQTGVKDPAYQEINDIRRLKEDNEAKRLFYVACTRAINKLFLTGSTGTKDNGMACKTPSSGSFLKFIWEIHQAEFEGVLAARASKQQQRQFGFAPTSGSILLRRLPVDWHAPVLAQPVSVQPAIAHDIASRRQVSYRWVSDTGRHIGTVVHELLKQIAANGTEQWSEQRVLSQRSLAGSELLRLGVPGSDEPAAAKQVLRAVSNTLQSQRGRWILSNQSEAHSEWAIGGIVAGTRVSGVVDRAFRDEAGTFWIIDYKTSQHLGAGQEKFLAAEKARYQPQLEQYAAVIGSMVAGPINLGLYFPLLDEWLEWPLVESAAAAG